MTHNKLDGFRKAWVLLRGRYFCLCSLTNSREKSIGSCNIVRKKWIVSSFQTLKSVPGEKTNRNLYISGGIYPDSKAQSRKAAVSLERPADLSQLTGNLYTHVYTMIHDHQVFHCISIFLFYLDL